MDTLFNYFFTKAQAPEESKDTDVVIYMTRGNTMTIVRLSEVKKMTDRKELYDLWQRAWAHVAESFDQEECENGSIIIEEIKKKLNAQ